MKKEYKIEESLLYKQNMKIQKNLWKPYTLALIVSIMVIAIKSFT
ncbi:MAG: hypothetical protein WBF48_05850 [Halarcobacter sp.]